MPTFLSHSFQDEAVYSTLCLALDGAGIERWNREEISAGESLAEQLRSAIIKCESCILIATRRSVESPWCLAELGAFWGAGKKVILFMVDPDLADSVLPPQFKGVVKAESVQKLIESLKAPTPQEATAKNISHFEFRPRTHAMVSNAFSDIIGEINRREVKIICAEFIQHSSEVAYPLILSLVDNDAHIELFLQSFETAERLCGEEYRSRVKMRIKKYPRILNEKEYRKTFSLYQYQSPATLNGARLTTDRDEKILILGWYTYSHEDNQDLQVEPAINGGDNPCIRLHSFDNDYKHFDAMFDRQIRKLATQGKPVFQATNGDHSFS